MLGSGELPENDEAAVEGAGEAKRDPELVDAGEDARDILARLKLDRGGTGVSKTDIG